MIEIKEGWTADEAYKKNQVETHERMIEQYKTKIATSEAMLHQLRLSCAHRHVLFSHQEMICDVCNARLTS